MHSDSNTGRAYDVGYGKPPPQHQFRKGVSGNPSGKPKIKDRSLTDDILDAVNKPLKRRASGKRGTITPRRLGIRKMVEAAAAGDLDSLKDLLRTRRKAGRPQLQKIKKVRWVDKANSKDREGWRVLTEEFYRRQDEKIAKLKKGLKSGNIPLADIIEQELNRRVSTVPADGAKPKRMTYQQAIAQRCAFEYASANAELIKLLQDMLPERRNFMNRPPLEEVARPTAEEREWMERHR